jgi:hypothetical protein
LFTASKAATCFQNFARQHAAQQSEYAAWAKSVIQSPFSKGELPDINLLYDSTSDDMAEDIDNELEEAIEKFKSRGLFEIKTEYLGESFFTI